MAGIYVHIPFCRTHCTYCGFYSELLRAAQGSESFVEALCREISTSDNPVEYGRKTLYFGGGTPSLLGVDQMERIVKTLGNNGVIEEFTVEVNPDDVVNGGLPYLEGLRRIGVNRISMGIQSFDDTALKRMGRRHDSGEAVRAYALLREAGFDNLSLDFIFGFSDKFDVRDWVSRLMSLPGGLPEHLSCYQLSIEEGSGLEKMLSRGLFDVPSDEECRNQYDAICFALASLGYEHYEISNWAKPGFRSRHNCSYWNHTPYAGFGPGAHSLFVVPGVTGTKYIRRWNNPSLRDYLAADQNRDFAVVRGSETLTPEQVAQERVMLGLRTSDGILRREAASEEKISKFEAEGLLVPSEIAGNIRIPESKWFVSDDIISDL